jgi:hypothetical protein
MARSTTCTASKIAFHTPPCARSALPLASTSPPVSWAQLLCRACKGGGGEAIRTRPCTLSEENR